MAPVVRITGLCQADVAFLLRRNLGPTRAWEDMLADMRSGKASYRGLLLLPVARVHPDIWKVGRPVYDPADVAAFINAARIVKPPPARPADLDPVILEIDANAMSLPWSMRRAKPVFASTFSTRAT